jgi:hypothetical protein
LDRLPLAERAALSNEISGLEPSRPDHRFKQMLELGIFDVVSAAVDSEVNAARAALAEWPGHPPTHQLLALGDELLGQVAALRPAG